MSTPASSSLGNVSSGNFTPAPKTKGMFDGTKEFMDSNSIIAKIAYLFFVLVIFILLLRKNLKKKSM